VDGESEGAKEGGREGGKEKKKLNGVFLVRVVGEKKQ
jgi:hypothetical protein